MNSQHILVVEDDPALGTALSETLNMAGYVTSVVGSGEQAMTCCGRHRFDAVISDINLPGMDGHDLMDRIHSETPRVPVILMTGYANTEKAVAAIKAGAADYLVKPFPPARLIQQIQRAVPQPCDRDWIARDPATRQIKDLSSRVAKSDATVLISGESGTGKEVLARFIHSHSARAERPFVAVNCAALPDTMLESILFGHEKGAFTGASRRQLGKFEQADSGTLFLDEIAEMPLPQQAKLLRVLQEREVERLGGSTPVNVDVRVLTATNRNLAEEVAAGRFREDLFYRLNVFPLQLPPLRERPGDIQPLAEHLLKRHNQNHYTTFTGFTDDALRALAQYHWPGNIRELENTIQRACVISSGPLIQARDLLLPNAPEALPAGTSLLPEQFDDCSLNSRQKAEYRTILETLNRFDGHRGDTARDLGISTRMLRYKMARMRQLGIIK